MGKVAKCVIGANYGDEGKGLLVDYFAHKLGPRIVVVRFNGGSQASHTVVTPEGIRHVFGHFGSGTLAGCRTHLSRFFISNPITFLREYAELDEKGFKPRVTVDPRSIVTTYPDMILNQGSERFLGRKASCGLGINETVTRSEYDEFKITIEDLRTRKYTEKLLKILHEWVPIRMRELGIDSSILSPVEKTFLDTSTVDSKWLLHKASEEASGFLSKIFIVDDSYLSEVDVIFEGAQGLLLDQDHENYPWVTRSSTGIANVLRLFDDADLSYLDLYYVTRAYLTRHGHGPLPNSSDSPIYPNIKDDTNLENKHQGKMRYAPLNVTALLDEVLKDANKTTCEDSYVTIAVTCLDQVPENVHNRILSELSRCRILTSYGPTRNHIKE